jgi:hypothetical protein
MSNLSCGSNDTSIKLAIANDATSDAGANRNVNEVSNLLLYPKAPLSQSSQTGIVAQIGGDIKPLMDSVSQGHFMPARKVRGENNLAIFRIYNARRSDAYAGKLRESDIT